jgi:hypothetical protein
MYPLSNQVFRFSLRNPEVWPRPGKAALGRDDHRRPEEDALAETVRANPGMVFVEIDVADPAAIARVSR